MRGQPIPFSLPRRFLVDLLQLAAEIPTVPVQRRMKLQELREVRDPLEPRPGWPVLFLKAYALVAEEFPELRRACVQLPWPQLYEYPTSVASIAVERIYCGEPAVFFGRITDPARMPLRNIHELVRRLSTAPIETIKPFRKLLELARYPRVIRKFALWLGLNLPRTRAGQFGTFGLSVYSSWGRNRCIRSRL